MQQIALVGSCAIDGCSRFEVELVAKARIVKIVSRSYPFIALSRRATN